MQRLTHRAVTLALLCASALAASVLSASAGASFTGGRLGSDASNLPEYSIEVDGTRAVWVAQTASQRGKDLMYMDWSTMTEPINLSDKLDTPNGDQFTPTISGNRIVYTENVPAQDFQQRLRLFTIPAGGLSSSTPTTTDTDRSLDQGFYYQRNPQLSGDWLVFEGDNGSQPDLELFHFTGETTGTLTPIAASLEAEMWPSLWTDGTTLRVSYTRYIGGSEGRIHLYEQTADSTRTLDSINAGAPVNDAFVSSVWDDKIVWEYRAGPDDSEIYYWDLTRGIVDVLTSNTVEDYLPTIRGERVFWFGNTGTATLTTFNFASGGTGTIDPNSRWMAVGVSGVPGSQVAASGNSIVWNDGRDGRDDVYRQTRTVTSDRLSGTDRFDAAVQIAKSSYFTTSTGHWTPITHVIIASGEDAAAADPLSAAGLCWAYDAPLLLVNKAGIPASTRTALTQIVADNPAAKVIVVGGPASVPSSTVGADLQSIFGTADVERLLSTGGRYEMAAAVSQRMRTERPADIRHAVFIANGADNTKFFDALALSAVARNAGIPILLVSKDAAPAITLAEIAELEAEADADGQPLLRYAGGGPNTITDATLGSCGVSPSGRWYGADRYATSVSIAEHAVGNYFVGPGRIAVASKVPDALTGGVAIGRAGGVLLVTGPAALPASTGGFITTNAYDVDSCYILGGTLSITNGVKSAVDTALNP